MMNQTNRTSPHVFPSTCPRPAEVRATVNGQEATVYRACVADFLCCTIVAPTQIVVELPRPPGSVKVRPAARGITPDIDGTKIALTIPHAMNLRIDVDGRPPLHIHANAPADAPTGGDVLRIPSGQVVEAGELTLQAGQTLFLEPGSVLRGSIRASDAPNLTISGPGVLDGSYYTRGVDGRRTIRLERCPGVRVSDLTLINPTSWMTELRNCDGAVVHNYRGIGECLGSDGVDLVGTSHAVVEDCMILNHDDQVVVKSFGDAARDVEDIVVRRCVLANVRNGAAMEIGHELTTDSVSNITFRDIDVLECHGHSSVFSIRTADRATVRNVLFEDIRVEHFYEKLVDFRVIRSRYSRDAQRGRIRDVTLRRVRVVENDYNPGYSMSTIGGYDAEHDVRGVRFEDVTIGSRRILSADALDLFTRHAQDVTFA